MRAGFVSSPAVGQAKRISKLFLVPQRPYNVAGTFADQVTYPEAAQLANPGLREKLYGLLDMVGLTTLRARYSLDAVALWADVLSLGEQQRLGMARLFFHCPTFAVLDQCTDAVSIDVEKRLYDSAAQLGVTIITVSQRPALTAYHHQVSS